MVLEYNVQWYQSIGKTIIKILFFTHIFIHIYCCNSATNQVLKKFKNLKICSGFKKNKDNMNHNPVPVELGCPVLGVKCNSVLLLFLYGLYCDILPQEPKYHHHSTTHWGRGEEERKEGKEGRKEDERKLIFTVGTFLTSIFYLAFERRSE